MILSFSRYYGATVSETVLGKCLKALDVPRSDYVLSTKCGRYAEGFDFSEERVMRSVDESLQRLGVDYVDVLQIHDIEFASSLDQVRLVKIGKPNIYLYLSSINVSCSGDWRWRW